MVWRANLETKDNKGRSWLNNAVVNNHKRVVDALILWAANLDTQDTKGHTPLIIAA